MANLFAIHSVGHSLATFLSNSYPDAEPERLRSQHPCEFRVLSSGELTNTEEFGTTLSLLLYRVSINEHLRNSSRNGFDQDVPLALDLHYLMTVWSNSALEEQTILCWALRQLYLHPILNLSSLSPEAGWTSEDVIRVAPEEVSDDTMMRIWDALEPSYRLSFAYRASVVRVDADTHRDSRPVVAERFAYGGREALS